MFVKCIDDTNATEYLQLGEICKVVKITPDWIHVEGKNVTVHEGWYYERFEVVTPCPRPLSDLSVSQLYTIARHANAYKATPGNHLEDCRGEMLELCRLEFLARGIAWPQHSSYTASA